MSPDDSDEAGLQLRSRVTRAGELELSFVRLPTPAPAAEEVVVRIEAAPINPSDIGLLFGPADMSAARITGRGAEAVVTAPIRAQAMPAMQGRLEQSMPVGNEGAGVVVRAGSSSAAQAMLGKTVAVLGGAMYSQFRCLKAEQCLVLSDGTAPRDGASAFVNPLTALGMVETMRREGHSALVHTAAASNLGQMLNRICRADGIGLVNVVRKPEQAALLRKQGATQVCDSSAPDFAAELTDAIAATGATLGFDAIGGGRLAGQILGAMEAAINRKATEYSRYGSSVHKQVYVYGSLDPSPLEVVRSFGMAWGVGGWLLFPFLQKIGPADAQRLRERVAAELTTTFASHYAREISLLEMLEPETIKVYGRRATGEKFLVDPNRGLPG